MDKELFDNSGLMQDRFHGKLHGEWPYMEPPPPPKGDNMDRDSDIRSSYSYEMGVAATVDREGPDLGVYRTPAKVPKTSLERLLDALEIIPIEDWGQEEGYYFCHRHHIKVTLPHLSQIDDKHSYRRFLLKDIKITNGLCWGYSIRNIDSVLKEKLIKLIERLDREREELLLDRFLAPEPIHVTDRTGR